MYIDETILNFLIGFMSALLLCAIAFWWYYQEVHTQSRALAYALKESEAKRQETHILLTTYKERLHQGVENKKQMHQEFKTLSQSILQHNAQTLQSQHEAQLKHILSPFQNHIKTFQESIERYYHTETKERFSLTKEIQNLQRLNLKISEDASNLTKALKGDNKLQGDWGEMILSRVLESSGLREGDEYHIQNSYQNEKKERLRPDVIINLPKKRQVIIDAKVSLVSYERYYHDRDNSQHLKAFLDSLKSHIKGLSEKSYERIEGINSLDFVLLFIPIEGAFSILSQSERSLFEFAYQKNIILVSPSTLLAVLRVIENAWRFEYQNKNAKIIAKKAGALHDKFFGFIDEMYKVEQALLKANGAYTDAFKKLSTGKGNLIDRTKELKTLEGSYQSSREE